MHRTTQHRRPRKLELRPDTIRALALRELRDVAGGVRVASAARDSCDPCPGEYTWFCVP